VVAPEIGVEATHPFSGQDPSLRIGWSAVEKKMIKLGAFT
jgi:hypothetical protein